MEAQLYGTTFQIENASSGNRSAAEIVPILMDLLHPDSVIDLGCGTGSWLSAFARHGVSRVRGYDGDYVDRSILEIAPSDFIAADLSRPFTDSDTPYDLAISLEVAEHIQEENSETFLANLTSLARVILFSAAVPGQGGVAHVNEQWPSYWARKFAARDYHAIDCLRPLIWANENVVFYYAQNTILYVHTSALAQYPQLIEKYARRSGPLDLVHPRMWSGLIATECDHDNKPIKVAIHQFNRSLKGFVGRRLPKRRSH